MKKINLKLIAALALPCIAFTGCTKENNEPTAVVVTSQSAIYVVDGEWLYANPQNEVEWSDFVSHLIALAEEGHSVQFWRNESQLRDNSSKVIVTFTTTNSDEAKKWATEKIDEGYTISITYDHQTGIYTCVAIK